MSLKGDVKAFVRKKCKEGWSVERTKKGHFRWLYAATGAVVISAATPSDHRTLQNTMADIKRCERPSFVRYTR
jgi:hypothetical protein